MAGPPHPYVSRGGVKLAAALDAFGIDPAGLVCLDVGASTGGFTDCLLQRGAARVYAVDVGHGQLDARLRADPRVVVREKVNARALSAAEVAASRVDLAVVGRLVHLAAADPPGGRRAREGRRRDRALVKPQFEAGRGEVPRGGVVRSEEVAAARRRGDRGGRAQARPRGRSARSRRPIQGARGNEEFLLGFRVN